MRKECQCEHKAHIDKPCNNYPTWSVLTTYGYFNMCSPCKSFWEKDSPYFISATWTANSLDDAAILDKERAIQERDEIAEPHAD